MAALPLFTHTQYCKRCSHYPLTFLIIFFKCEKNKQGERIPLHQHTKNEYVLIHTLSHFLTIVFFFSTGIKAVEKVLVKYILKKVDPVFLHFHFLFC